MNATVKTPAPSATEAPEAALEAAEAKRHYATNAVDANGQKVRNLRAELEPTVEQIASRVQQAVHRGLAAASKTGARAQEQLSGAAELTGRYISDRPGRSLLALTTTVVALAALVILVSRRHGDE